MARCCTNTNVDLKRAPHSAERAVSTPTPHQVRFTVRDVAEVAVGACIMAFPVAVTEEVWNLGEELRLTHILPFAVASLLFLGLLIYILHHSEVGAGRKAFLQRVLSTYFVTLLIAALLLWGVDRFDLVGDFWVSVKRAVLVAFPASFAATAVDSVVSSR